MEQLTLLPATYCVSIFRNARSWARRQCSILRQVAWCRIACLWILLSRPSTRRMMRASYWMDTRAPCRRRGTWIAWSAWTSCSIWKYPTRLLWTCSRLASYMCPRVVSTTRTQMLLSKPAWTMRQASHCSDVPTIAQRWWPSALAPISNRVGLSYNTIRTSSRCTRFKGAAMWYCGPGWGSTWTDASTSVPSWSLGPARIRIWCRVRVESIAATGDEQTGLYQKTLPKVFNLFFTFKTKIFKVLYEVEYKNCFRWWALLVEPDGILEPTCHFMQS